MEGQSCGYILRMLVIITDMPMERKVLKILDDFRVPVRYQFRGKGTANSEFLEICGLSEISRAITTGFVRRSSVHGIFRDLDEKMRIREKGRGIAFTVPINGLQSYLLKKLEENRPDIAEENGERNEEDMKEDISYAMILTACSQGYSGEVMEAARRAGATGGTIMTSRVSIQEEQEVVSIIVPREIKKKVMREISEKCGCRTPAKGIILSLPVDEIIGLS